MSQYPVIDIGWGRRHEERCVNTPQSYPGDPLVYEPGRVRKCEHGIIQIARSVPGWAAYVWFDMRFWDSPGLYLRAAKALKSVDNSRLR